MSQAVLAIHRPSFRELFLAATPFWKADFPEFAQYARAIPYSTTRELDGRGHEFNQETFPEMIADIHAHAGPR